MKVCVLGLWHLGSVTAACLAAGGHDVVGLDFDDAVVEDLSLGKPPLFEPDLDQLVADGLASGRLRFTTDTRKAVADADVVWVAYDTPVDSDDRADVDFVKERVRRVFPHLRDGALVLVSSQMPTGSTSALEASFAAGAEGRRVGFAYSPENLRLGKAIAVFSKPDRVIVGTRGVSDQPTLVALWAPFTDRLVWMSVESAEMTKHALNAFLATSVTFINEIAALCEQVGADASEVERGLKTEERIGPKAYLGPGGAFAGGTLARDIQFLAEMGRARGVPTPLLSSVKQSNDGHRQWAQRRLTHLLGTVRGRTVAVWGLAYKSGTDTLRRSSAIELCEWLASEGAVVRAYDPLIKTLPASLAPMIALSASAEAAADGASALVVSTLWPELRSITPADLSHRMTRALVLDANRFLGATLSGMADVDYYSVGRSHS